MSVLSRIKEAKRKKEKMLAVLVDPDKVSDPVGLVAILKKHTPDLIFVGGSILKKEDFLSVTNALSEVENTSLVIFPGSSDQISDDADAILLLSLISGRNPEYLIGQHVKAARRLNEWGKEIIPTSYILMDGGKETAVQKVSQTNPICQDNLNEVLDTVLAGSQLGHQLCYLEAGSGAQHIVEENVVKEVSKLIEGALIVGGGIRTAEKAKLVWNAGATVVVVGTAFEHDIDLLPSFISIKPGRFS